MSQQQLETLTETMGAATAYLQQCAQQAADGLVHSQQQLKQSARDFDAQTRQLSQEAVREIARQTQQAITQGLAASSEECNARLKSTGESARESIYLLNQQIEALQQTQRKLVWKAGLALVVGALVALIGLGAYGWQLTEKMQKANYTTAVLTAMQAGKIVVCGEQLCAKVGKNPRKAGANGEYMAIEP